MLKPPESLRYYLDRRRALRGLRANCSECSADFWGSSESIKRILSTLRAAREREREMGVGK